MNESLKRKAWDLIRPIHAPITRRVRRMLGRNYFAHPEMELPPPYESIQLDVERHLHDYLHVLPQEISLIAIAGAYEAGEVDRLHRVYPRARFLCFEPNPPTYQHLVKKFAGSPHVTISNLALSNTSGKTRFYELDMPGNGSMLEPEIQGWANLNKRENVEMSSFEVEMSTLDREADGATIDLLWMDVQGAEGKVLEGAAKTLPRTKSVFLEVALAYLPYKGAPVFQQVSAVLQNAGFTCVGLGVDASSGVGNAFFVKNFEKLVPNKPAPLEKVGNLDSRRPFSLFAV